MFAAFGEEVGEIEKYLSVLRMGCGDHLFVQGLVQVEVGFEQEVNKYMTA